MQTVHKEPLIPSALPPPPPPPPPPLLKLSKPTNISSGVEDQLPDSNVEVTTALRRTTINLDCPGSIVLSFYKQVKPVIQDGPMCGLVALCMAFQLLLPNELSMETIFAKAKDLKFTKLGEMFSAEAMGALAETLLHCKTQVLSDVRLHKEDILKHILEGWPVLFPYDSDKNHEPCCQKGHSAHWAVITGLCLVVSDDFCTTNKLQLNGEVCHFNDGHEMLKFLNATKNIYVYAHQGKSRHLAAWNLNNLICSNENLVEVSDKHRNSEMVMPSNFQLCDLKNKAVLLSL